MLVAYPRRVFCTEYNSTPPPGPKSVKVKLSFRPLSKGYYHSGTGTTK